MRKYYSEEYRMWAEGGKTKVVRKIAKKRGLTVHTVKLRKRKLSELLGLPKP